MMQKIKNIVQLGFKELRGLMRDPLLLGLILYTFTVGVYVAATATPDSISNAALAIVDEDNSQLSQRIADAFSRRAFCGRFRFHALKSTRAWTAATTRSCW